MSAAATEENELDFFEMPDTEGIERPKSMPEDEYRLQISGLVPRKSENAPLKVVLSFVEYEDAEVIYYNLWLPGENDNKSQKARKLVKIAEFKKAFGIEGSGRMSREDLIGKEAWAKVRQSTDEEYGDEDGQINTVSRWVN